MTICFDNINFLLFSLFHIYIIYGLMQEKLLSIYLKVLIYDMLPDIASFLILIIH